MMELFKDELLDGGDTGHDPAANLTDDEINEKYAAGEVRIVTEQARYPLPTIRQMVESDNYRLDPDYQRRRRWTQEKQSRLIETFIMNVPVPPIFLYEDRFSHFEVMDGQQRLTAIAEFYDDVYELDGLEYWPELNGRKYSQLPEQVQRGIDRRYLSSIILLYETAKDEPSARRLKQLVFQRINSGGVKLESQETRNAIYDGPLNRLCIRLAENPALRRMWAPANNTTEEGADQLDEEEYHETGFYKEMKDVELVLRFFAYRQRTRHRWEALNIYLDRFLCHGNEFSKNLLRKYERLFTETIQLVYEIFGNTAFCRWRPDKGQFDSRPNKVIYDPLMFAFSQHLDDADQLRAKASEIKKRIKRLFEENESWFAGRQTNKPGAEERNRLMTEFISQLLTGK